MAIKGITDQIRYQRAGKIYLGIKEKTSVPCKCKKEKDRKEVPRPDCRLCMGTGYIFRPKELDCFVLKKVPELEEFYQDCPKELHVMLPKSWNLEQIFPQSLKLYGTSGLKCAGDGEKASTVIEGKLEEIDCPCDHFEKGACAARATFNFRITERQNTMKVYQIVTGSYNSIVNLNTAIRELIIFSIANRIDIADIKLILKREEQRFQRIDKKSKKIARSIHWPMTLDIDPAYYDSWREIASKTLPMDPQRIQQFRAELPPPDFAEDALALTEHEETPPEVKKAEEDALKKEPEKKEEKPEPEKKEEKPEEQKKPIQLGPSKTPETEAFEKAQKAVEERDALIKQMNMLTVRLSGLGVTLPQAYQEEMTYLRTPDDYKKFIAKLQYMLDQRKKKLGHPKKD